MSQQLRITVSGDLEGIFVVIEARSDNDFEAEHGPFLPDDREG